MATAEELAAWRLCPRCAAELEHAEVSVTCPGCGFSAYANPAPTASALLVDRSGRILLSRRADAPKAGLWDLPGGFFDEGESPGEALRRELREETGVEVEPGAFVGGFPDRYGADGPWTINFYWEARVADGQPEPQAADDVAELRWFPRDALPPRGEFAFPNTLAVLEAWGVHFTPARE
jgi:ADP-ribose pyrophosphatase YjhB (NUDIX family)